MNMNAAAGLPRAKRLVFALALLTGALLALVLSWLRLEAVRTAQERTGALAQAVAEQTARTLQAVDVRLQLAVSRLDGLEAAGTLNTDSARAMLAGQLKDLPFVRAIWVMDAQGRITVDSDIGHIGTSLADRDYFRIYQQQPATEFYVGPLVVSRTTGTWLMSVSRPVRAADGSIRGVITAALEPPYFEQLWRGSHLGGNGVVALFRRDGQLMMRSPANQRALGQDFSSLALFRQLLPKAPQGGFVGDSAVDGVRRMVHYIALAEYPQLLVAVGAGYAEVLAPWQRFAVLTVSLWSLALLVAAALTWQLQRQARSRERTERRFRELAQAMPQVVFVSDSKGRVQFMNQRWTELTGSATDAALGTGWREAVHPEDIESTLENLRRMIATGGELEHEMRMRSRLGGYRWQLLRAVPFAEVPGELIAWYGTATDIDDMKQAQARLHEQAALLKMAGRLARLGGWHVDLASERVTWSDEAAAILDMTAERPTTMQEVIGMFAPRSLAETLHSLQDCIDRGQPFDVEVEMITPTGRHVWLRSIGLPVLDADGKVVALQGAQQDITQRVQMVEEIRRLNAGLEQTVAERTSELSRQEALFRTLAEQAPLPFWTVDAAGGVIYFSRAWYDLAGGMPPQWHGQSWLELLHPDDREPVRQNWKRVRRNGGIFSGTRRLRARDGTYHTTSYRAAPVRNQEGEIVFWVGVDTDITDLMANEAALRLANEQLESFAYSVSHDLQSPLQRVHSFARLLGEELKAAGVEGRARHYLARIRANADFMTQLIEGLLSLAQVSEVDMIRSAVNLSDVATEILQRLEADHSQRRVAWRVQPGLAVLGDVRLMRSVMENLIGNAWKFTAGKPQPEIEVGGSQERHEYFVRDTGAGFDMAYADRLFGTFQRLHDPDQFPGTGIGLATVARAITRQGGRVWAKAVPGEGATFFFTLPKA